MYFCYNYNYYKSFTRQHLISKHNILNSFDVNNLTQIEIIFSLKNNKRECNLLLFWLIFSLTGRKPIILKVFSGFKKAKLKFILRLNARAFIGILRVFSIFILAEHEKKKQLVLKKEQSSYFFLFSRSYLEYLDTFCFYSYIGNPDLKFLLENLNLIFKFKSQNLRFLSTTLNTLQLPITNDSKGNNSSDQG
jgi:hypothetical protein